MPTDCAAQLHFVLHGHMPYVRQPTSEQHLEAVWYFEAVLECWLPLLAMLERLESQQIGGRFSVSLSPTLLELFTDPCMRERFEHWLVAVSGFTLALSESQPLARELTTALTRHHQLLEQRRAQWQALEGDLVRALKSAHDTGRIELLTTAATHGLLPLLQGQGAAIERQIAVGLAAFTQAFGFRPKGFWLPECGYMPGLDAQLATNGIEWTVLESTALTQAVPPASVLAPIVMPSGVVAFGRHSGSAQRVWSSQLGYPGNAAYREYYRDAVHLAEPELVKQFGLMLPDGQRLPTAIKVWRIAESGGVKLLYDADAAHAQVQADAMDFVNAVDAVAQASQGIPMPVICAPFDAELFGHWWGEGPLWLEAVFAECEKRRGEIQLVSGSDCLEIRKAFSACQPVASSWGKGGSFGHWLNADTEWLYPALAQVGLQLEACLRDGFTDPLRQRAVLQAARFVLLAQASDWPFILRSGTTTGVAMSHLQSHLDHAKTLLAMAMGDVNVASLEKLEAIAPCFRDSTDNSIAQSLAITLVSN